MKPAAIMQLVSGRKAGIRQLLLRGAALAADPAARGKTTSGVEVTNVSRHGFWLLVHGKELFASFASFPWFSEASIGQILNVAMRSARHLHWPDLDVDLTIESLENPDAFPLASRVVRGRPLKSPMGAREVNPGRARSGAPRR